MLTAYDQLEETTIAKERIESDLYGSMTPAKEVGGDLYNFLIGDDAPDKLYFALGDVSEKGVPAKYCLRQRKYKTFGRLFYLSVL